MLGNRNLTRTASYSYPRSENRSETHHDNAKRKWYSILFSLFIMTIAMTVTTVPALAADDAVVSEESSNEENVEKGGGNQAP